MAVFCVVTFCLNEEKFLPYAIRSWLASKHVASVVVVEGAVQAMKHHASPAGLSRDATEDCVREIQKEHPRGGVVKYVRHGWARDKAELQNVGLAAALKMPGVDWVILAGADELYTERGLEALSRLCNGTGASVVCPNFLHFWRRPDVVVIGSSWSVKMHRVYRVEPGMRFGGHAAPPFRVNRPKTNADDISVYHYVGMQNAPSIQAKLALYKARDGHRLNVRDTWSDWQWGEQTQWTHGAGSAKRFDGKHPSVVDDDVWQLCPRDGKGRAMPIPVMPWDHDVHVAVVTDAQSAGRISRIIEVAARYFSVELFAPEVVRIGGLVSQNFDSRIVERCAICVCAGRVILRAQSSKNVRLAIDGAGVRYYDAVVKLDDPMGLARVLLRLAHELRQGKESARPSREAPLPQKRTTPKRLSVQVIGRPALDLSATLGRQPQIGPPAVIESDGTGGGRVVVKHGQPKASRVPVKIRNETTDQWKPSSHLVQAIWLDGARARPIRDAPMSTMSLPKVVRPGEVLDVRMPVPIPPTSGMLYLAIDVVEKGRRSLGVGPLIPVRTVL